MLKRLAIQSTFIDGLRVTDAAMVAKSSGLIVRNPCASRMVPSGTNHIAMANDWMKNKIISSAYSAWRSVLNTGGKHTCKPEKSKQTGIAAEQRAGN